MSRRRGSIALMAVFLFAVISLLSLVIFSRIEDNLLLLGAEKDEKQASYYAESLAYLANEGVSKKRIIDVIQLGGSYHLPAVSMDDVSDEHPRLSCVAEKGSYTAVKLEISCTYKGIGAKANLRFEGVNPLFIQEDGVLSVEEMNNAGVYEAWQPMLAESFAKLPEAGVRSVITREPLHLKQKDGKIVQVMEENQEIPFHENTGKLRWEIESAVETKNPLEVTGVLWLKKGSSLKGDVHVKGVLIREPGATVEGQMVVDGLLIGENTGPIRANFQPRPVEQSFYFFDDFIKPSGYRLKKLY